VAALTWRKGWSNPPGHLKGEAIPLTCSLSLQITLSPSLFKPEDFTPLDPTQEPIFPPELLVGNDRESPAKPLFQEVLIPILLSYHRTVCLLVL
jgi:hypothetical protein